MNKKNYVIAADIDQIKKAAAPGTTVFADGSTFDYTEGYKSNGAPTMTRDRISAPIVKTYRNGYVLFAIVVMSLLALIAFQIYTSFNSAMRTAETSSTNKDVVKAQNDMILDGIEASGGVVVDEIYDGWSSRLDRVLIRFGEEGNATPCYVTVATDGTEKGFVDCGGQVLAVELEQD